MAPPLIVSVRGLLVGINILESSRGMALAIAAVASKFSGRGAVSQGVITLFRQHSGVLRLKRARRRRAYRH